MTDSKSPQPSQEGEGGGMLPALLAGAGILAVAALFIFGDNDEAKQADSKDGQVNAASASANGQPKGGVAARQTDNAKAGRKTPKLNPRIAEAVVTEGMAPTPTKEPVPDSFSSPQAEIEYWEKQLVKANNVLESRERSSSRVPTQEAKIRETGSAEQIADFERRKAIVADNLQRAQDKVNEIEDKLAVLRG